MKLNLRLRFQNPMFVAQIAMSILMPILTYAGLTLQDLTTWKALGDLFLNAMSNPYCLGLMVVSVYNAIVDPTTKGVSDSEVVMQKKSLK